jgi:hypothetical protein
MNSLAVWTMVAFVNTSGVSAESSWRGVGSHGQIVRHSFEQLLPPQFRPAAALKPPELVN